MSLQIWLPLNGDLHNQGLSNIEFINNSNYFPIIDNNGKIGKCYSFNGSTNYLRFLYPMSNLYGQWSFCCWVKPNNITSSMTLLSSRKATGAGMSVFILSGKIRFDNGTDSESSKITFTTHLTANTWQHICVIQTASTRQLYINGILKEIISANPTTSNTAQYMLIGGSSGSDSNPTGNYLNGCINDMRIYSHALSAKEVEEIAKGLVLHYPLNDLGGQEILSGIIYDTSGYGNNGTVIGSLTTSTPSPRYNCATSLTTTSSKIKIDNLITTGFTNSYSFAWWGKVSNYSSKMMWGFSNGVRLNGIFSGNFWNTADGSNNPIYNPNTTTQVTAPTTNVWHHFVMTGNGTKCYVYKDGELWGEAKTYKSISGTTIYLNGWDAGTSYALAGTQLSDFRIYATALTAEQVTDLYHTSMSIDSSGNIYARELVET